MQLVHVLLALQLVGLVRADPELLNLSSKSTCIKEVVHRFVSGSTCQSLSDVAKSELALKMTNCLLLQLGKPEIDCLRISACQQLKEQNWHTFTTFYTHIDNLCHFYWDVSKSERAEQMAELLISSATRTEHTLQQNNRNTMEILDLQMNLKLQIIESVTSQQQMSTAINQSSLTLATLTSEIEQSLSNIQSNISTHYTVISKVLAGINQILDNLSLLQVFLLAEADCLEGILYFICMLMLVIIGCMFSDRIRRQKSTCFVLLGGNFLIEYFLSQLIKLLISVTTLRFLVLAAIAFRVCSMPSGRYEMEKTIVHQLKSDRIKRIMRKTIDETLRSRLDK